MLLRKRGERPVGAGGLEAAQAKRGFSNLGQQVPRGAVVFGSLASRGGCITLRSGARAWSRYGRRRRWTMVGEAGGASGAPVTPAPAVVVADVAVNAAAAVPAAA